MVFIFKRGRNLIGYDIVLYNRPGSLAYITSIPEKFGLNIVYFEKCGISEETGKFFMAVDFTEKDVSPEKLLKEFTKDKNFVVEAKIAPTLEDIIYASSLCIKDLGGMRVILFGLGNMKGLLQDIKKNLGKEAGESFLYHLGYGVGSQAYKIHAEPREIEDLYKSGMLLQALFRGGGWAEILEFKIEKKIIIIKLADLWECEILEEGPASHYVRGILGGFFSELLKTKILVRETRCIAAGDPYCQFEVSITNP